MAQLQSVGFLVSTTLVLLLSCHHVSSLLFPTPASPITKLQLEHNNATDRQALVSFKSSISSHPTESLAAWNDSVHFCLWPGITCSGRLHPQRVVFLNLRSLGLDGVISPAIANLTFLRKIDLSDNQIHGSIPQEIGRLSQLQHLNLTLNSLEGGIPATLSSCSQLQNISMRSNMLQGEIPPSLVNCSDLRYINLMENNLTGLIPPWLPALSSLFYLNIGFNNFSGGIPPSTGNISSITHLYFEFNQLSGGIPPSLGKLSKLTTLTVTNNTLSGSVPTSLWNLSSVVQLDLSSNYLSGLIPPNVGQTLPLLELFFLYGNQFHGPIPVSLSNASHLIKIDFADNRLTSTIPPTLGGLPYLQGLILTSNQLEAREPDGWSFLTALTNCTSLEVLQLGENNLGGVLPDSIANLSTQLWALTMEVNYISGSIPAGIGHLVNLEVLVLDRNLLTGTIPASIGMLSKMNILNFYGNNISGEIPSTLGNFTKLLSLDLSFNELSGTIPASLGNCQMLNSLELEHNKLTGGIPKEILAISSLSMFLHLEHYLLTGLIPSQVGTLRNLAKIDFSMNKLSGEIPSTLSECLELQQLYLGGNLFYGSIPSTLSALRGIKELDVSQNNLSGRIPDFLQDFHDLYYLNLSYNNFEGEVPRHGVFDNKSGVSILGNNKLCGGNPKMQLPACSFQSAEKKHESHTLGLIIAVVSSFLVMFLLFCLFGSRLWMQKSKRKSPISTGIKEHAKVTYSELVKATNGFSTDNLIGEGSFGAVYKGMLDVDGVQVVAVKVLNLQLPGASKSFISECEALRNIRHRNLVKIITVCSSIDFRGSDFKAVVLEFMENGNLDDWLYPKGIEQCDQKKLNLIQRLNIAIDVASAFDYLHHHSEVPIIHCDLKPSNILLDRNMIARVGDFGLAKFLKETISMASQGSTSSIGLKGTIGYIAPEYGVANKVSTHGDVYSYGILLLEMFTAKRPTDDMFKGGQSLRKSVELAFPEQLMDVMDAHLLLEEDEEASDNVRNIIHARTMECVTSVFRIGILSSNELPTERMDMGEIISELHKIRDAFLRNEPGGKAAAELSKGKELSTAVEL